VAAQRNSVREKPAAKKTQSRTLVTAINHLKEKPSDKQACLVVIYGAELGKKYNLEKPTIGVGRSSKSGIQIDQESVSRNHAKVVNTGKTIILRDLGSTNGTYVNDELVDEHILTDGDFIKIGRTIFKFLSGSNIENSYHEEIYRLTTIDGLTQIFNKRYFLETLDRETGRAIRYRRALSLILFDIDHFKNINDSHGHLAGDSVLKQLAEVVRSRIRREDTLARYGGEEFAIVLPEVEQKHAFLTAEKLRKLVEKTAFKFEDTKIAVTISLGVEQLGEDIREPSAFIKKADEKLYQAKTQGRNQVC